MHRSWTGYCIYRVRFEHTSQGWVATEAVINDEPSQYRAAEDARELEAAQKLISILLLGRHQEYPTDSPGSDSAMLQQWSVLGRAMFSVEDEGGNGCGE